jgi:hypothetical protein
MELLICLQEAEGKCKGGLNRGCTKEAIADEGFIN